MCRQQNFTPIVLTVFINVWFLHKYFLHRDKYSNIGFHEDTGL